MYEICKEWNNLDRNWVQMHLYELNSSIVCVSCAYIQVCTLIITLPVTRQISKLFCCLFAITIVNTSLFASFTHEVDVFASLSWFELS